MAGSELSFSPLHIKIQGLMDQQQYDEAAKLANDLLNEDPKDATALFMFAQIMNYCNKKGVAYNLYQQVVHYKPKLSEAWNNLGGTLKDVHWYDEAMRHFNKSIKLDPDFSHPYNNIAVMKVENKEPEEALKYAREAIKRDPTDPYYFETRGFARLMLGDWDGFDDYEACLDTGTRPERAYGSEPRWNGEKNKTVVFHREQGIGDEIMFSQLIPLAIQDCKKVILDIDPRLVGLFKRSFPEAEVYGTGFMTEGLEWLDHTDVDYHCPLGTLFKIYKEPNPSVYLEADPIRVNAFKSFLSADKPNIGIAWRGGKQNTGAKRRTLTLDHFKGILKRDANFVSLEYLPYEGGEINHYPWITEKGTDYDNAAALVEGLDLIISVATSIVHLAGALGKECWCLTPELCNWRFGKDGKSMPFHSSLTLYREAAWDDTMKEVERDLDGYIKSFHRG